MKKRDVERFIRTHLLPAFPGWQAKGYHMFMTPVGDMFRSIGFQCDSSVYISAGVYPLYVPGHELGVNLFASRIGTERALEPGLDASIVKRIVKLINAKGLPLIDRYDTPAKLVANADLRADDPHRSEAVAYSYVLLDQPQAALRPLDAAIASMNEYVSRPIHGDWGPPMLARLARFRALLPHDPAGAKSLLARQAEETAVRTGLTKHR